MTDALVTPRGATPKLGKTLFIALLMGVPIAVIGVVPWVVMARLNVHDRPELPWAAAFTLC